MPDALWILWYVLGFLLGVAVGNQFVWLLTSRNANMPWNWRTAIPTLKYYFDWLDVTHPDWHRTR